ncbi:MAG: NAD(P)-binding domain-containing protein [Proteobacteria bacterium]|nr:NAD(P)-binding domain-containing protein [Pseudomonadota bacterium]
MVTDKYAIVGAGFCGLGVAAAFKRHGILYDQFEADDDVGGNWYHGVYDTVHIISSRKTTQYSDWPMPDHWPDFPSKDQMLAYLREYADHWKLRPNIAFSTRVEHIRPVEDSCWEIALDSGERRVYGGVVVCNGHHWDRRMPSYPGHFSGQIIHSKDYRRPDILAGKKVLVIGGGNSACDIAVEAARFAKGAHISMRRGYWFMPKTMFGVPTIELLKPWMPVFAQRVFIKTMLRAIVGRYESYGLDHPDHDVFEKHPTINTELLHFLRHGRVIPHNDISRYDGSWVEFKDGSREQFDLIICATGYHVSFPFMANGVVTWNRDGMPNLITGMLPPAYKNIYFFGTSQPRYGAGPLISAGAEALCTMVGVQKMLTHPLGAVLERLGEKPPKSWLQDPHRVLRAVSRAQKFMPRLPALEKDIMSPVNKGRSRLATLRHLARMIASG